MTRDHDQENGANPPTQSPRKDAGGQTQSQHQGAGGPTQSQRQDKPSTDFARRADDAARRLKSSSDDKGLARDDRGQEGNKTGRDQEDKTGTDKDRTPPLQSPQDDLA